MAASERLYLYSTEYFRLVYARLAMEGRADSVDSMEFRRVLRCWVKAGRPSEVETYIRTHAAQRYEPNELAGPYAD